MTAAKKYLNILKEREPERWQGPLTESALTEQDLSEIEKGLGYTLPIPYRDFLLRYRIPEDLTVLVSFCGDSFANSWEDTFKERAKCAERVSVFSGSGLYQAWKCIWISDLS